MLMPTSCGPGPPIANIKSLQRQHNKTTTIQTPTTAPATTTTAANPLIFNTENEIIEYLGNPWEKLVKTSALYTNELVDSSASGYATKFSFTPFINPNNQANENGNIINLQNEITSTMENKAINENLLMQLQQQQEEQEQQQEQELTPISSKSVKLDINSIKANYVAMKTSNQRKSNSLNDLTFINQKLATKTTTETTKAFKGFHTKTMAIDANACGFYNKNDRDIVTEDDDGDDDDDANGLPIETNYTIIHALQTTYNNISENLVKKLQLVYCKEGQTTTKSTPSLKTATNNSKEKKPSYSQSGSVLLKVKPKIQLNQTIKDQLREHEQKHQDHPHQSQTTTKALPLPAVPMKLMAVPINALMKKSKSSSFSVSTLASIPKWLLMLLMFFTILAQAPQQISAEKSKHYYMQSLCKSHFLQQLYRKIDGAVLWSQNERNLDCVITFQTHSILQRFMLRFDMLQLDCNDHLLVYDGAHAVSTPKIDISCRQTKQSVSSILTRTNFVTLKYTTDAWGTDANGFKLVITAVKDPKHTCKDFTCNAHGFCIHPDLKCDGINHCGDNSDESVPDLCQNETDSTIFGLEMTWFVLLVVSGLLLLSAVVVGISICFCRRQDNSNSNQNSAIQMHHSSEANGLTKHLLYHHGGTLSRDQTHIPSNCQTSGNWHHPAGPLGYHRIQHSLLKMATKVRPIWFLANSVN